MKDYSKNDIAVILLDSYQTLEYKHKWGIISLYKNPGDIFGDLKPTVNYAKENLGDSAANTLAKSLSDEKYKNFILGELESNEITAITYLDSEYPQVFANLPSHPLVLYAKGNVKLLKSKNTFGIVGSRKTQNFILKTTEQISSELSASGVVIVSGSAVGGDRSAILGAVEKGNVISVLAGGYNFISPQSNRDLIQKVAKSGLVISEYPPSRPCSPWHYPMRNRLIAALSNGVLIVSGELDSGTKYTAKFAEAYSKSLYAIPYSLGEKSGQICNMLIKMGKAQLIECAQDVADFEKIELKSELSIDLDEEESLVLSVITGNMHVDDIALKLGKKSYEILPTLSMLEIKGAVAKGANNTYTSLIK